MCVSNARQELFSSIPFAGPFEIGHLFKFYSVKFIYEGHTLVFAASYGVPRVVRFEAFSAFSKLHRCDVATSREIM